MYSDIALKLYGMIKSGIIKSNAMFWREFFEEEKIRCFNTNLQGLKNELDANNISLICVFDENFPVINLKLKSSEKPFLFAYKGDIKLIKEIDKNIAVIGVLTPTKDIENRQKKVIKELVAGNQNVVSGLAKGCDTIAHKSCLETGGKTIAVLPTTLDNIYPKQNISLADEIVSNGGLIITEYVTEPQNRFERINRFISRDRLQAMFSKAVILIASYVQQKGDSGSRHAMQKAKEYKKLRLVMFNAKTDSNSSIFELNEQQLKDGAISLTNNTIKEMFNK